MEIDGFAMIQTQRRALRTQPIRQGFTFFEFMVALVVLGIALSGLFPLLAISSRELRPIKQTDGTPTFDCRTPARDWGTDAFDDPQNDSAAAEPATSMVLDGF